jgi:hypothetical protein
MDDQRAGYRLIIDARPFHRHRAFAGLLFRFERLDLRRRTLVRDRVLTLGRRLLCERGSDRKHSAECQDPDALHQTIPMLSTDILPDERSQSSQDALFRLCRQCRAAAISSVARHRLIFAVIRARRRPLSSQAQLQNLKVTPVSTSTARPPIVKGLNRHALSAAVTFCFCSADARIT